MRKVLSVFICLLLLAGLTVAAFATDNPSPTGTTAFQVEIIIDYDGKEPVVKPIEIVPEGETITIIVPEEDRGDFTGWVIDGDYEIISGSLDDPNLVIKPLGDIVIHETHDKVGPTDPTNPTNPTSPVSPPTGNNNLVLDILFVVLLLAGVGAAIAVKKLASKKTE